MLSTGARSSSKARRSQLRLSNLNTLQLVWSKKTQAASSTRAPASQVFCVHAGTRAHAQKCQTRLYSSRMHSRAATSETLPPGGHPLPPYPKCGRATLP